MAGYGVKVETDTGRLVWVTETGTSATKGNAIKFDSEDGAEMYRSQLASNNPHATLVVAEL